MRIAQVAPLVERVPPDRYGGTELVISTLTEELVRRGHQVTLFASGDSITSARLVPTIDTALWHHPEYRFVQPFLTATLDLVAQRAGEFDIIHNHLDYLMFPLARLLDVPVITTLHGRLDLPELQPLYRQTCGVPLVSISDAQRRPLSDQNWIATINHGLDLNRFPFCDRSDGYLAFLGRIAPEKGLETAIRAARRAGVPIRIAARLPLNQPNNAEAQRDWHYFREVIEPLFAEPGVEYVGEIDSDGKAAFLGGAAALLFPIQWPEPFGLVMIEALATGTPVLAFRNGSTPEIVEDGRTGLLVDDEDGLVEAIRQIDTLSRHACRHAAETRFTVQRMADRYEEVYRRVSGAGGRGTGVGGRVSGAGGQGPGTRDPHPSPLPCGGEGALLQPVSFDDGLGATSRSPLQVAVCRPFALRPSGAGGAKAPGYDQGSNVWPEPAGGAEAPRYDQGDDLGDDPTIQPSAFSLQPSPKPSTFNLQPSTGIQPSAFSLQPSVLPPARSPFHSSLFTLHSSHA